MVNLDYEALLVYLYLAEHPYGQGIKKNKKYNMKLVRILAFITGLLTLAWQVIQVVKGNGQNIFLVADIILGIALMVTALLKPTDKNISWLMAALGFACGVFATATFGALTMGTYNFGAFTTTVGLLPCLASLMWLIKKQKI
jgi:peptidoglycan/LPS O-acetylase OafA/YrhL